MALTIKAYCDPGISIEDAFSEAIRLANKLNCPIEFEFNEVICWGQVHGKITKGVNEYHEAIKSCSIHKYANSI